MYSTKPQREGSVPCAKPVSVCPTIAPVPDVALRSMTERACFYVVAEVPKS